MPVGTRETVGVPSAVARGRDVVLGGGWGVSGAGWLVECDLKVVRVLYVSGAVRVLWVGRWGASKVDKATFDWIITALLVIAALLLIFV